MLMWRLLLCSQIIILFATSTWSQNVFSQDGTSIVSTSDDGRTILIQLANQKYFAEAPLNLGAQTQGLVAKIGLVHSGYSTSDPDGKSAILTLTLTQARQPLSPVEEAALMAQGYGKLGVGYVTGQAKEIILDISLPNNMVEESRIRGLLGLPRTIANPGSLFPVQIKWSNVPGKTLYAWLAGKGSLTFFIRYKTVLSGKLQSGDLVSADARQAWWTARFGSALKISTTDGLLPIMVDLLSFSSLWTPADSLIAVSKPTALALQRGLQYLNSLASVNADQSYSIERSAFVNSDWSFANIEVRLPAQPRSFFSPGTMLQSMPSTVKDLSGNSKGLDALLIDSN